MAKPTKMMMPLPRTALARSCAGQHFGPWAIDPKWFANAMSAIKNGTLKPRADWDDDTGDDESMDADCGYTIVKRVAVICMDGNMTKKGSSFGGCSTIATRQALRAAAADYQVDAVLLKICSPGGSVSGTSDLADDVLAVRRGTMPGMLGEAGKPKPVDAFIEDMGCSAAYWVASQCETIMANKTAIVGSIGTYCILCDDTGAQEQVGITYRVVSTGAFKGLGADGKVSAELVSDVQREVNELNAPFLAAVAAGRGKKIPDVLAVADGRAWVGENAMQIGLIDEITTCDAAIGALSIRSSTMNAEAFRQFAAEHPEAVATYIEQGKKAAVTETLAAEKARGEAVRAACPGNDTLALDLILAGKDASDATIAVKAIADAEARATAAKADAATKLAEADKKNAEALAARDKEITRLTAELGSQAAVGTAGATRAAAEKAKAGDDAKPADELSPEALAEKKYDADPKLQDEFTQAALGDKAKAKRAYVKYAINAALGRTPR